MDTLNQGPQIPTDLHVSAIVQIGKINATINLNELARALNTSSTVLYLEFGSSVIKGNNPKKSKRKHKSKKEKKFFYNQVTIHLPREDDKRVNMKIFNNGTVQMTGIVKETQGLEKIHDLVREVNNLSIEDRKAIFDTTDVIKYENETDTVLINSDFDIGFDLNREALHRLIIQAGYYSSYEPCIYPGVNIKYYCNALQNNLGICDCDKPCDGKGKDNTCKRITIAAFKSGKIIITGGRSHDNIATAYNFITDFIHANVHEIKY